MLEKTYGAIKNGHYSRDTEITLEKTNGTVIEDRKAVRKNETIHCHLRYRYFLISLDVMILLTNFRKRR
jgi:hypothetical protein